jgi:site-specific DNA-methyltransferase (adenine-specific)
VTEIELDTYPAEKCQLRERNSGVAEAQRSEEGVQEGVHEVDALAFLRSLPPASVDLVLTDPPYFSVKPDWWDRQWDGVADFLAWMGELAKEWSRVLRPNGSLFVFASPQLAARVEVTIGESFDVLNSLVWAKPEEVGIHRRNDAEMLRSFFPRTERIIFAEQKDATQDYTSKGDEIRGSVFEPIRAYLDSERLKAGVTAAQVNEATGTFMAGHWFTRSQWALPTREHYEALRRLFNANMVDHAVLEKEYGLLRAEYEELRAEYEELRAEYEELRRPFAVSKRVPFTDVWEYPHVQARRGKHPCEKPLPMLRHMIEATTRPGALVLDSFCGSGSAGIAAIELGRRFVGSEIDPRWAARSRSAIARAKLRAGLVSGQEAVIDACKGDEPDLFSLLGGAS